MNRKEKRGILTSIITGFIGLAYEDISSFLNTKRHKAGNKDKYVAQQPYAHRRCYGNVWHL